MQRNSFLLQEKKSTPFIHIIREGNGTPLQYSCLENPMDGGAWQAAVLGVAKSRIRLSDCTFTFHFPALEKEIATHSCSCLENPGDGGAWWAAVYGVTQSRTQQYTHHIFKQSYPISAVHPISYEQILFSQRASVQAREIHSCAVEARPDYHLGYL